MRSNPPGRVTIHDVARRAGVSIATVSNVLNGKAQRANAATVARIQQVAQELGYHKDIYASALKTGRSNTIWVLMPAQPASGPGSALDSPFFNDFLCGIERGASATSQLINFCRIGCEADLAPLLRGPQPSGVIVMGHFSDAITAVIRHWSYPTVVVDNASFFDGSTGENHFNSAIDDVLMGYTAARHLLDMGHRHLVLLFGALTRSPVHRQRYLGVRQAAEEAGGMAVLDLIETEVSCADARAAFTSVQQGLGRGATAVLAMADVMALGCYQAATAHGMAIPDDFSLMGMDNLRLLDYLPFRLTTVDQCIRDRGAAAVHALANGQALGGQALTLVAGTTTRAPRPSP